MKKLFLGAMAFLVAVTLVACGSKKDADESIKENCRGCQPRLSTI